LSESPSEVGLRDYLAILQRRKWIVIEVLIVLVGTVAIGSFLQAPVYRAAAALLVETEGPSFGGYEELPLVARGLDTARSATIETHKRLITTRLVLDAVIQDLDLPVGIAGLREQVSIETFRDTDVIEVHAEDRDPQLARDIANSVAENYILWNQDYNRASAESASLFLEQQLAAVKNELTQAEEETEHYKRSRGISDLDAETRQRIEVLGNLEGELASAEAEAQAAAARSQVMEEKLSQQELFRLRDSTEKPNPIVEELQAELARLEAQRAGLLEEYATESHNVRAVDAQIDNLKQQLSQQLKTVLASTTRGTSPVHDELLTDAARNRATAVAARKRVAALGRILGRAEAQLNDMPSKEKELARLVRAQNVADRVYTLLLEKYHEVRVAEAMRLSSARLVESAVVPEFPVKPRKKLNIALACVFGLILGIMLASLVEYLDDTIKDPDEIDQLIGAAMLGTVPRFSQDDPMLVTEAAPKSALTEAFQTVHANLNFASVDQAVESLVITSAGPGEGKTFVSANLALTMARLGKQVILVDADLRRPTVHKRFGIDNAEGLTTILASDRSVEEVLVASEVEGLRLLLSGPIPPNPVELLASDKMMELCQALSSKADLVLYDTPPIVMVSDAPTLAAQSDGVLLVIEQGGVSKRLVTEAQDILARAHARTIGAVLNKVTRQAGHYYYSYYYSYYYQSEEDQ